MWRSSSALRRAIVSLGLLLAVSATASFASLTFSSTVPVDPANGTSSTQQQLAEFAWLEFVALNWPAQEREKPDSGQSSYVRGTPSAQPFGSQGADAMTVWQTFKHRSEIYGDNLSQIQSGCSYTPPSGVGTKNQLPPFDSSVCYGYSSKVTANGNASFDLFNNLDETSEIGLADMYYTPFLTKAPDKARLLYEAKANQVMYDFVRANGLQDQQVRAAALTTTAAIYQGTQPHPGDLVINFPSGMVEIKATWRLYDSDVDSSSLLDTYHHADVVYYSGSFLSRQYYNGTALLLGLHIIHKTPSVPTLVFATFEHIDNEKNGFTFYNTNQSSNPQGPRTALRQYAVPSEIDTVNTEAQTQIAAQFGTTIWSNYRLIGVQAKVTNAPSPPLVPAQSFYLSNFATESNCSLQYFKGTQSAQTGLPQPTQTNVYLKDATQSTGYKGYTAGGCLGCHGVAQTQGADFSFITLKAPVTGPDTLGTYSYGAVSPQDCSNINGVPNPVQPQPHLPQ